MRVIVVDNHSPFLSKVKQLGDANRATLGFLPEQAFNDYATKKHINALVEGNTLIAYVMYRMKNAALIIVQLCVVPEYRNLGYAKHLIDNLLDKEKDVISHIQLACRRDYGMDIFWSKLGFTPIAEKDGRAIKQCTRLTIWSRQNPFCENIFTLASSGVQDKAIVVLDTNIVVDLCNDESQESEKLRLDFVGNYVSYYVSCDTSIEINSSGDPQIREKSLQFLSSHFEILQDDYTVYSSVLQQLLVIKPAEKYSNTWYDLSHIAHAIAAGASAFITRDSTWLNTSVSQEIEHMFGLHIFSPGEFIKHIDEIDSPELYAPQKLFGLGLSWGEMTSADYSAVVEGFYSQFNKKSIFEAEIRSKMADPHRFSLRVIKLGMKVASIACIEAGENKDIVSFFLINGDVLKPSLHATLVKWLGFQLLEEARKKGRYQVVFMKKGIASEYHDYLAKCGYIPTDDMLFHALLPEVATKKQLAESFILTSDYLKNNSRIVKDGVVQWTETFELALEKMFWPMKITPSSIPSYIVPINGEYAKELIDTALSLDNPSLFENKKIEPALSTEKVYFKGKRQSISRFPAQILWYVSHSDGLIGTGMIRACSILDNVEVNERKSLYNKYKRLGVVDWNTILSFGKPGEDIAAYQFSFTEAFINPIPLDKVRRIIGRPKETFQSFRRIDHDAFCSLYLLGVNGE